MQKFVFLFIQKNSYIQSKSNLRKSDRSPGNSVICYQCNSATIGQETCAQSDKEKLEQFKKVSLYMVTNQSLYFLAM